MTHDHIDEDHDETEDRDDHANTEVGRHLLALQERYPGHSATHSLMLTPAGNWMTCAAHHDETITMLLARLLMISEPRNEAERSAMDALNAALDETARRRAAEDGQAAAPVGRERYPLWCVDTQVDSEARYWGPYETETEARQEQASTPELTTAEVRRCRRLLVSEAGWCNFDDLLGDMKGADLPEKSWADFESRLTVEPDDVLEAEFWQWADGNIILDVFICDGDE